MDWIELSEIEVKSCIGVPDAERAHPQKLKISVEMGVSSVSVAAKEDAVEKTVDYYPVYQEIHRLAKLKPRKLLETLAEEIASAVLLFKGVRVVRVIIYKYIFSDAKHVSLTIERRRKSTGGAIR